MQFVAEGQVKIHLVPVRCNRVTPLLSRWQPIPTRYSPLPPGEGSGVRAFETKTAIEADEITRQLHRHSCGSWNDVTWGTSSRRLHLDAIRCRGRGDLNANLNNSITRRSQPVLRGAIFALLIQAVVAVQTVQDEFSDAQFDLGRLRTGSGFRF